MTIIRDAFAVKLHNQGCRGDCCPNRRAAPVLCANQLHSDRFGLGGSISPSGNHAVDESATKSFTLTPDSGFRVKGVGGTCPSGTLDGNSYTTGAIVSDCTVSATFSAVFNVPKNATSNDQFRFFCSRVHTRSFPNSLLKATLSSMTPFSTNQCGVLVQGTGSSPLTIPIQGQLAAPSK